MVVVQNTVELSNVLSTRVQLHPAVLSRVTTIPECSLSVAVVGNSSHCISLVPSELDWGHRGLLRFWHKYPDNISRF